MASRISLLLSLCCGLTLGHEPAQAAPAAPAPKDEARMDSSVSRSFASKLEAWRPAAERGEPWACYNFALAYHLGHGVESDPTEAVRWYLTAAEQGYPAAQANLGYCYEVGFGVPVDHGAAVKWYQLAAAQGNPFAQYNLGKKYYMGPGVALDPKLAERWLRQAAAQQFVPAYFSLGQLYAMEFLGKQDLAEAYRWFRMAAEQGYAPAQHALGYLHFEGKGVARNYFEAVKWYNLATSRNFIDSYYNLAICYERGLGVPQNVVVAAHNYRIAAEFGHPHAQYSLGVCFYEGKGVDQDFIEAYKWWNLAAVQGVAEAASSREILARLMPESKIKQAQNLAAQFRPRPIQTAEAPRQIQTVVADITAIKNTGTGFFISTNGYILTNLRLLVGAQSIQVKTEGGTFAASVAKQDPLNGLALLKVEGLFSPVSLGPSRDLKEGEDLIALGFDDQTRTHFDPKIIRGEVSALHGGQADPRYVSLTPRALQPFNGAAVLNRSGQVIAVIAEELNPSTGAPPDAQEDGFHSIALKSDHIIGFLRSMNLPEINQAISESRGASRLDPEEIITRARAATALIVVL